MVEIRVAVADDTGVHALVRRLAALFDRASIEFDGERNEVRVRAEWESRGVNQILDAVESWLAAVGLGSAELSIGDESYLVMPASGRSNQR